VRIRKSVVAAVVLSTVAAFVPTTTATAATATSTSVSSPISWGACPPPPPGSLIPDAGQECATIPVPLDYRSPNGEQIQVGISRVKAANPSLRRGVLLANPGGPGGAGIDMPRILTALFPQDVLDRYDIIGFDPRGVGTSTPVTCGLSTQEQEQAFVPLEQPGGAGATASFMQNVAQRCAQNAGHILPFITTANTARDMDRIRQALGEQKVSYFAYSYGTYLGAAYASLFPSSTDRFVLDSNVDPTAVWRQQFRDWGPGGAIRFPDFAQYVADNDATYHLGATQAQVRQTYFQLIDQLHAHPITLDDGTVLNDAMFRELTFGSLYNDADFSSGAAIWQLAKEGASGSTVRTAVSKLALDIPSDNAAASGLSVACNDVQWSRNVAQYRSEYVHDSVAYPLFGALGSNIWPCAFWANNPVESPVNINSAGPSNILMVQNLRDPATPYAGARNMHTALGQRSRLVSVNQGGHAIVGLTPNACANDTATNYLAYGTFPTSDTYCPAEPAAPTMSAAASAASGNDSRAQVQEYVRKLIRSGS